MSGWGPPPRGALTRLPTQFFSTFQGRGCPFKSKGKPRGYVVDGLGGAIVSPGFVGVDQSFWDDHNVEIKAKCIFLDFVSRRPGVRGERARQDGVDEGVRALRGGGVGRKAVRGPSLAALSRASRQDA